MTWDEGEHEGCGIDSQRAVERERATDEMVERAWAAIVGFDVAGQCFVCSLTRADLRVGLTAALAFENGKPSVGSQFEGVASRRGPDARETGSNEQWTIEREYRALLEAINHRLLVDGCVDVHTPLHRRLCRTLALVGTGEVT